MGERPYWLVGRETHAEMLPRIRAENEAWKTEHGPKLRAMDEERQRKREAVLAAIARHPGEDDRALILAAVT